MTSDIKLLFKKQDWEKKRRKPFCSLLSAPSTLSFDAKKQEVKHKTRHPGIGFELTFSSSVFRRWGTAGSTFCFFFSCLQQ